MTSNRVNAHLKRACDLLKQSEKGFGAPRLPITPIKQISIELDGFCWPYEDYYELMEKWKNNSQIQSLKDSIQHYLDSIQLDSIQHYLQSSYEHNLRMRNNTWTLKITRGEDCDSPKATLDLEYNIDDVVKYWSNAHLKERIALYPKYRALQRQLADKEGINLVTNAVNNALARSGDDWLKNIKVTRVFENSSPKIEQMLDYWHDWRYNILQNTNRPYRQNE